MAVNPTAKTQSWDFKGGRHNRMDSYQGASGLWYCHATFGSGRYCEWWALYVFPERRPAFSNYGRAFRPEQVLPMDYCLLTVSGKGGHDTGKSAMSKGGYRAGGSIPFVYNGKEFDSALLRDGDEFLKQLLGYEPSAEGIKNGIAQDQEKARLAVVAKEEEKQRWHDDYQQKMDEAKAKTEAFTNLFVEIEVPTGWRFDVESTGLHVWQPFSHFDRWEEKVFKLPTEFEEWKKVEVARQAKEAEERSIREAQEAVEKAHDEAIKAAAQKRVDELAKNLSDIKKKLGGL